MQGLIGRKLGMTQIFNEDGRRLPVTVIEAGPCIVVQRKSKEGDGYDAVQLGFSETRESRVTKPYMGVFKKLNVPPCKVLREFSLEAGDEKTAGDTVSVDMFEGVAFVDVTGTSKGRGFQGVVKRYNMRGGRMTHGGHSKRRVGAIGQCSYPARVAKNQRMPGHMGNSRVTKQNLRVVGIRAEDNLLLVHGAIPGPTGGVVLINKAIKKAGKA
jgi:large subunit ribosomal protein L3